MGAFPSSINETSQDQTKQSKQRKTTTVVETGGLEHTYIQPTAAAAAAGAANTSEEEVSKSKRTTINTQNT